MTRTDWSDAFVAWTSPIPPQHRFRILLDQGFPKPPGFAVPMLDATVEVEHLSDFDPNLSQQRTPDWVLYCVAAEAGFDALVARDMAQLSELVEMYVLSRLSNFTVITWRRAIEDPIREWGQLLAYLPDVKKRIGRQRPKAIILPAPRLTQDNLHDPLRTLAQEGRRRGISSEQARGEARSEMDAWLEMTGQNKNRFDGVLRFKS